METAIDRLNIDLTYVREHKIRTIIKQILSEEGFPYSETNNDKKKTFAESIRNGPSTLFFADLHKLADLVGKEDKAFWHVYLRKNRPFFLSLLRHKRDERCADLIDDLVGLLQGRISVIKWSDNFSQADKRRLIQEINKNVERYFSPDALDSVVYIKKDHGFQVTFNDGTTGEVGLDELGIEGKEGDWMVDEPVISEMGNAIELYSPEGEVFDIDALAIKSLLSGRARKNIDRQVSQTAVNVGERILQARRSVEMTQQELSTATDIDQAIISKIENGKHIPRFDTIERIAGGLRLSVRRLLNYA